MTTRDGAVVFPHVHLSNSEPDPFFERGGRHLHGREYHAWLSAAGAARNADGLVLSESVLFKGPTTAVLTDDCDTSHYNGVLALFPKRRPPPVTPTLLAPESTRYALNPLFSLSISRGQWRVNPHLHGKSVAHLLDRHPVYQDKLPTGAVEVHDSTLSVYLLATAGETTEQITAAFHPVQPVRRWLQFLEEQELVRGVPMSAAGQRMQRFHANQLPPPGIGTVAGFWSAVQHVTEVPFTVAGRDISGPDLHEVARLFASAMSERYGQTRSAWLVVTLSCCGLPSSLRPAG